MGRVTGAELAVRALRAEGIETVFTLVGDHILPICDVAVDHGIRFVDTRHESAAVHMADAFARITGRPSVALVTGGPGHANSIAGLAVTYLVESPVVHISGRPELDREGMSALQELDQVGMAAPVTKGAWMVRDTRRIPEFVALAFRTALGGRPGPVHLTIPIDLQEETVDEAEVVCFCPAATRHVGRQPGDPALVEQAIALLAQAERPVVIAGAAARFSVDGPALQRFIEEIRAPLFTVEHGRGLVSDDHPLCLGYADGALNEAARAIGRADVLLLLGKKLDFRIGFGRPPAVAASARVIQVEPAPAEIGRNRGVAVGILGDIGAVVEQLHAAARGRRWAERPWVAELRAARRAQLARYATLAAEPAAPLHPMHVAEALRPRLPERTIMVFDGGDFVQWGRAVLPAREPGRWLRLGPLAHLGAGLPFGLAAKVACPGDPVVVLMGDGGLGFHFMEFDTALRHGLNPTVIVGNDAAWGIDRQFQIAYYGRPVGTDLRPVRYDRLVAELGGRGEHVADVGSLGPALDRALASDRIACVDVAIQRVRSPLADAMIARRLARQQGL
ncbi:MAG: thiamine pyrophosphate-binding protein [Chloroflexi bacterium]|nr:thiamine pyrophosphate-binding protein [Chloroflexota bacterium]